MKLFMIPIVLLLPLCLAYPPPPSEVFGSPFGLPIDVSNQYGQEQLGEIAPDGNVGQVEGQIDRHIGQTSVSSIFGSALGSGEVENPDSNTNPANLGSVPSVPERREKFRPSTEIPTSELNLGPRNGNVGQFGFPQQPYGGVGQPVGPINPLTTDPLTGPIVPINPGYGSTFGNGYGGIVGYGGALGGYNVGLGSGYNTGLGHGGPYGQGLSRQIGFGEGFA